MTPEDLNQLAKNWITYWTTQPESQERDELFWVCEKEWDLVREDPESAWRLILEVLKLDQSNHIMEVLSAGPLEDLLAQHGLHFIERVEREAKNNPGFATLLGGVWKNTMSDDVWARVQASWDRKGWDGIPSA
jgi:hypothetical protein